MMTRFYRDHCERSRARSRARRIRYSAKMFAADDPSERKNTAQQRESERCGGVCFKDTAGARAGT